MTYRIAFLHLALITGFAALAVPSLAWGQASPQAEALFRDGKRLMKDGKFAEACAAFEGSERVEHSVATLLSLADCREKNHQYASAWALFLQADSQTRSDPAKAALNATAKTRALGLEPRLSYLTINVPDDSRVPGLVVSRDGAPVDPAEWNHSIPADGGHHIIAGKAPGHESWSTTIDLAPQNDKQSVEVPRFKALRDLALKDGDVSTQSPPAGEPGPFTPRRRLGLGVAAGGVVIAGVAIALGVSANSLRDDALATCPPTSCSVQGAADAQDKNDRARRRALYANLGFGVATAAVATGVVLWFLGKPESAVAIAPQLGATNGLAVTGRF
jgi:hypothetical protein